MYVTINGVTKERVTEEVVLRKNGSFVDVHLGGKWIFGLDIDDLVIRKVLDGETISVEMTHDVPVLDEAGILNEIKKLIAVAEIQWTREINLLGE